MFAPSSLLVLASCRYQSENLSSDQFLLKMPFFSGCFYILDLYSVTDLDSLLLKHCGELLFISSGSPRVVLENIYCLINSLCQVKK